MNPKQSTLDNKEFLRYTELLNKSKKWKLWLKNIKVHIPFIWEETYKIQRSRTAFRVKNDYRYLGDLEA